MEFSLPRVIALFTDFGWNGPYVGQMHGALLDGGIPVIDLMHDAPCFDQKSAAYLLASLAPRLPEGSLVVAVVDPGVGSHRRGVAILTKKGWFVGPDNGLLAPVARSQGVIGVWEIVWLPEQLSASFHGRDLFAPVAARIATGDASWGKAIEPESLIGWDWPNSLKQIIYVDHFGNLYVGVSADAVQDLAGIRVKGITILKARTFSDVAEGALFWYENSCGLVEIAANKASAAAILGVTLGDQVEVIKAGEMAVVES